MPMLRRYGGMRDSGLPSSRISPAVAVSNPASSISVEQFTALSKSLTQAASLDTDVARTLLGAFIATGHEADLAALIADPASAASKNATFANAIVAAWYSGVCNTANGQAIATFDGALMWNAMTYTKPFGVCGGDTGYWSDPPKA